MNLKIALMWKLHKNFHIFHSQKIWKYGKKLKSKLPVYVLPHHRVLIQHAYLYNACVLSKTCTTNRLKFVDGWSSPDLCVQIIRQVENS